jgi:hypothetical protein
MDDYTKKLLRGQVSRVRAIAISLRNVDHRIENYNGIPGVDAAFLDEHADVIESTIKKES